MSTPPTFFHVFIVTKSLALGENKGYKESVGLIVLSEGGLSTAETRIREAHTAIEWVIPKE